MSEKNNRLLLQEIAFLIETQTQTQRKQTPYFPWPLYMLKIFTCSSLGAFIRTLRHRERIASVTLEELLQHRINLQ